MEKNFSKLCTPAKIYFAIAVIATIISLFNRGSYLVEFMKMVFAFIWTFILGWLCNKGYSSISWFLVLLPYIVIALAMLKIANITQHKDIMSTVKLQGAYGKEPMKNMYLCDSNKCEYNNKNHIYNCQSCSKQHRR
jgi:hypothetical protein